MRPPEPVPSRPERSKPSSLALFLAAFVASGSSGHPASLSSGVQRLAEELRAVLKRRQHLTEDGAHVVQASLELGLDFHAFDRELYLAQLRVKSDFDLHQDRQLGLDRQMDLQVLYLKVDLLDADDGYLEL